MNAIQDPLTRKTAYETLTEVCFSLGMRKAKLAPELGNPDLLAEAALYANYIENKELADLLDDIGLLQHKTDAEEVNAAVDLMRVIPPKMASLPPWFLIELGAEPARWISMLERVQHLGANAAICVRVLPPFFTAIGLPDAAERSARLRVRAVDTLIKSRHFRDALLVLAELPERNYKLEAQCHEGAGNLAAAAEAHRAAGNLESAIDAYRRVPDIKETLAAIKQSGKVHTAAPALEWIAAMQALAAKRPDNFNRVIKPEEKKLLESILESSLGVQRKKPATKKAATKRAPAKKAAAKKPPARKLPERTARGVGLILSPMK